MDSFRQPFQADRGWWDRERFRTTNGYANGKNKSMMDNRYHHSQNDSASVASLDSMGKKKSFRRLCERFAEKTSMQGIPYIHNAKLIWAKLIWTLLLLGAIGGMTVHLKYLFDNYFEFEKATKIELGFDNLKFPSITLCNTNIIKRSSLESLEDATALKKLIAALKPENLAPGNFEAGGNTNQNQGNGGGVIDPNPDEGGATGQETPPQPTSTLGTTKPFTGGQGGGTGVRTGPPPENATPPGDQNSPPPSKEPPRVRRQVGNNEPESYRPPLHNFNITEFESDFQDYLDELELGDDEYDSPLDTRSRVYNLFTYYYMDLTKKTRESIGHNISQMLISCSFGERICDSKLFHVHQTSEYGNCWTLNSRKFVSRTPGPSGGLELVLYLQLEEYLKGITNGYGIRLVVHHPNTYPFPYDEGIFVAAAMETSIGLKLRTITRIGPPHGTCEEGVAFEENYKIAYTRTACQASCVIFKVLEVCGCFEDGTEEIAHSKLQDAHPCRRKDEERCMIEVLRKFHLKEWTCDCQNPCHETEYIQSISQRQWPSDDYAQVLLDSACYLDESACGVLKLRDARRLNYNFLKLNIYFEDLNYENVTEAPEIETVQFLSDVGGAIGLWIGLSLLSLCELGQLFIELFAYFVHRTRNSNERNTRRREREKNKKFKENEKLQNHIESKNSKGMLSVPDIKLDFESGSGRSSPHSRRYRDDTSQRENPRDRRFMDDRSPRGSPRGSPWTERRAREDFGMYPPTRY